MELSKAIAWAAKRRNAVLVTIRADGRPQSSDITYALKAHSFEISVTSDRAKTANMRRDPRVVLHITDPATWSYVAFDGTIELSPVTTAPDDDTNNRLVDYYRTVSGKDHPDWTEYREAMIKEGRLITRFTPTSAVGQIHQ